MSWIQYKFFAKFIWCMSTNKHIWKAHHAQAQSRPRFIKRLAFQAIVGERLCQLPISCTNLYLRFGSQMGNGTGEWGHLGPTYLDRNARLWVSCMYPKQYSLKTWAYMQLMFGFQCVHGIFFLSWKMSPSTPPFWAKKGGVEEDILWI